MLLCFTNHSISVPHQSAPQVCPLYIWISTFSEWRGRIRRTSALSVSNFVNESRLTTAAWAILNWRPRGVYLGQSELGGNYTGSHPPERSPPSGFHMLSLRSSASISAIDTGRTPAGQSFNWLHAEQSIRWSFFRHIKLLGDEIIMDCINQRLLG